MAIVYNEEIKVFNLETEYSTYQMKVGEFGFLLHLYYGEKLEADSDLSYLIQRADRGFSGNPYEARYDRTFSLDYFPQEYSCFGNGDYRADSIQTIHADGSNVTDLRYKSHKIYPGKYRLPGLPAMFWREEEGDSLEITMEDPVTGVQVVLYYGVLEKGDVITRSVRVMNGGQTPVELKKAMSLCLDMNHNQLDFIHFYGRHTMERQMERGPLHHGKQSIGSLRGISSHHHNPFVILCDRQATEERGDCYGMMFLYSGNFLAEVEVDQIHQTRAIMGIHPEQFSFHLKPGEDLVLPEAAMIYTHKGLSSLSLKFHDAIRQHIMRGEWAHKRRPILINNWEATYFDFNGQKLVDIARDAKELGIEMLVMDDGWFGKRDSDNSGLGDWVVNEDKLGCTLKELVAQVNSLGLKFGMWFEPEMICEDSNLYRAHPDWMMRVPGRAGNIAREQFVLDYTRKEVRDYIEQAMSRILDSANIEYIKWDMNRSMCNVFSAALPAERQGEISYRYVLGLYELLERLTSKYPHILFEGCSGGGGRFDAGMLYYTPQIWCSDDTDAIERLKIQYGTSFGYPIGAVGSHVSACPNHQTRRITPIETRGTVAMAGTFGYELDLTKLTQEEKKVVRQQVEEYKKYDHLVHEGDYYRLSGPYGNDRVTCWQFMDKEKKNGLFCAVYTRLQANPAPLIIKLKGLDKKRRYEINGRIYSGAALMYGGLLLPVPENEYQSFRFEIQEKENL